MLYIEKERLVAAITARLPQMSREWCEDYAQKLLQTVDKRLEPNVIQWINGEPVEDLWIGKYCINGIMHLRRDQDFLGALEAMNLYLQDEAAGERMIWRMKM